MRLSSSQNTRRIGLALVFIFALGVFVLAVEILLPGWLLGQRLPHWSFSTYLIVASLVGIEYIVCEIVFSPVRRLLIDRDQVTDPLWKRSLRLLALLSIVAAFALVAVLLRRYW